MVEVLDKYMNNNIASIWLKMSAKGRKTVHLGAVYREHKWIRQPEPNNSGQIDNQNKRWKQFLDQWVAASARADTLVIGDTNIDYNKWASPDNEHTAMTDMMKSRIETLGFQQIVQGDTRFSPNAANYLIDQCWTHTPARILLAKNHDIALSDHNMI